MGLRVRVIILIALTMLPVLALVATSAIEQRRKAASDMLRNAENFSRIVALYHERTIEGARQMLNSLAQTIGMSIIDDSSCSQTLASLRDSQKAYANIGVIALSGKVLCSSIPVPEGVNLGDRSYFLDALKKRSFSIGDYQVGRITGMPSINFGHPVFGPDGEPTAVVFAAIDLRWFEEIASQIELPEHSHMSLIDRNGKILSRHPSVEVNQVDSFVFDAKAVAKILGKTNIGSSTLLDLNGVRRLVGFARMHVRDTPLSIYAAIATPETLAFAAIDQAFWRNILFVMIVAIVTGYFAWGVSGIIIKRPFNLLMDVTTRLSVGDLSARTNLDASGGELGVLGQSFDIMANSLQRHIELKRYMSPQIADMIVSEKDLKNHATRRKEISVIFIDLRGFTAFAECTPPDTVILVLKEFFASVAKLVLEHDGTIGATLGDGMMIYFNDPVEVPDHASKAVVLALAIKDVVSDLRQKWRDAGHVLDFGIGVTTGPAIIGLIGFDGFRNYTVLGSTVNLSSRLCSKAERGTILVSEEVVQVISNKFHAKGHGDHILKGFEKAVPVYEVVGPQKAAA